MIRIELHGDSTQAAIDADWMTERLRPHFPTGVTVTNKAVGGMTSTVQNNGGTIADQEVPPWLAAMEFADVDIVVCNTGLNDAWQVMDQWAHREYMRRRWADCQRLGITYIHETANPIDPRNVADGQQRADTIGLQVSRGKQMCAAAGIPIVDQWAPIKAMHGWQLFMTDPQGLVGMHPDSELLLYKGGQIIDAILRVSGL